MKIAVPQATWSAVAPATAFLPPPPAYLPYEPKAAALPRQSKALRAFSPSVVRRRCSNVGKNMVRLMLTLEVLRQESPAGIFPFHNIEAEEPMSLAAKCPLEMYL